MKIILFVLCIILTGCKGIDDSEDANNNTEEDDIQEDNTQPDALDLSDSDHPILVTGDFFDDFEGSELDSNKWLIAHRNWGGLYEDGVYRTGGVHKDNISVSDGNLVIEAHGNYYSGDRLGVDSYGNDITIENYPDLKSKVGGAIATKEYFQSGLYLVKAKIIPKLGVCSAFWTFHYEAYTPGDEQYIETPFENGDYYVINHEIDIELPGRPTAAIEDISYETVLLNHWRGVLGEFDFDMPYEVWKGESNGEREGWDQFKSNPTPVPNQADGEYHIYGFDWHTGDAKQPKRVDYYIDGVLVETSLDDGPFLGPYGEVGGEVYVPDRLSRFWVAAWFPYFWAGTPEFDTEQLLIDWVYIHPYDEAGDVDIPETYPDFGWYMERPMYNIDVTIGDVVFFEEDGINKIDFNISISGDLTNDDIVVAVAAVEDVYYMQPLEGNISYIVSDVTSEGSVSIFRNFGVSTENLKIFLFLKNGFPEPADYSNYFSGNADVGWYIESWRLLPTGSLGELFVTAFPEDSEETSVIQ